MRLKNIKAIPHPFGNKIEIIWDNPDPVQYPGVCIRRKEGTYPVSPDDGCPVTEGENLNSVVDENLKGETVYYYMLFPYKGDPPEYQIDRHNRISSIATSPYGMAERMYNFLPGIYHKYDAEKQLRYFLDIPGSILDQLYSFTRSLRDACNIDKIDGALLPLLAQWIGWKTDFNLEIQNQRNEVKYATSLYKTIGIIPTVEATVKRITNWECRTKEFVHNIFLSNRPEQLNLWEKQRNSSGNWSEPTKPLSVNFAYKGRPSAVWDDNDTLWLFYHTNKRHYKKDKAQWKGKAKWKEISNIWYKTYREDREEKWSPSKPLTFGNVIYKNPSTAFYDGTLWVFWSSYEDRKWKIKCSNYSGDEWVARELSLPGGNAIERKNPHAITDDAGLIWLFWMEKTGNKWQLKYSRYDGSWGTAFSFPLDSGFDPKVERDLFVCFHPNQTIWVFWSRKESAAEPNQTRWTIAYRIKVNMSPDETGWSEVKNFSTLPPEYHDCEPTCFVNKDGNIELFWSSNRAGSWSIWHRLLEVSTETWGTEKVITTNPFSERNSLPIVVGNTLLLIYRSNESTIYTSEAYKATETIDFRAAGCTTVDVKNLDKISLRGEFEDFQTYTYDAGINGERTNDDWYARDTIGLYLTTDTMDEEKIKLVVSRVSKVLKEFMPVTDRAVFITKPDMHTDYVYTYEKPFSEETYFISENFKDVLTSEGSETVLGPGEELPE
jgi:phage tail-like protein